MADKEKVDVVNPASSPAIQDAQREAQYFTLKRIKDAEEEAARLKEEQERLEKK